MFEKKTTFSITPIKGSVNLQNWAIFGANVGRVELPMTMVPG